MKTVCKKLFCLMLVALMLVSAVPFAFATENTTFWIQLWIDGDTTPSVNDPHGDFPADKVTDEAFIKNFAASKYPAYFDGYKVVGFSQNDELGAAIYLEAIPCEHTNKKTVNTATCTDAGTVTVICKDCDAIISSKEVAALGHDYNGATCEVCGDVRDPKGSITFHYMTSAHNWTEETVYVYENGQEVTPPAEADDVRGFKFLGWTSVRNGAVDVLEGFRICWNSGTSKDYWAAYDDDADDDLVHLTVKVAYYVNGKLNKTETLLTSEDFPKNENRNQMFRWLYGEGFNKINNALFANGDNVDYKWNEVFYLNNKGTEKVSFDMMDDGNKIVYVVLNSKDYIEANVQLYVHKSKSSSVYEIIDLDGYTAGDKVTRDDVIDALEDEKISYSSLSYLYNQTEWENLLNGDNADGDKDVAITHNGTTKIHVIAKSASSSSNADSSNPKTGDSIMIAVTTMTLAAAALVAVVELKKRKMI